MPPITGTIVCATSRIARSAAGARVPHTQQSEAANALLQRLRSGLAISAQTISHSRGAVAVAVGDGDGLLLGIDIEWMRPNRPFAELADFLFDTAPAGSGAEAFYRTWTFYEAYFKAFQQFPTHADLHAVATANDNRVRKLSDHVRLKQFPVAGEFQLSLVWRAPATISYAVRCRFDPCRGASGPPFLTAPA